MYIMRTDCEKISLHGQELLLVAIQRFIQDVSLSAFSKLLLINIIPL